jgi:CBS domain-containing protein
MEVACPALTAVSIDVELVEEGRKLVVDLLNTLRAYDVMSESSKILVYDTALPFKQAYHGLVEHDTNCAPLWDSKSGVFAGCFSMSDVVDFMRTLYTPSPPELGMPPKQAIMTAFAQLNITTWRAYALSLDPSQLVSPEIQRSISRRLDGEAAAARGEGQGMSDTSRASGISSSGGGSGSGSGSGSGGGGPGRGGLGGRPDRPRLIAVDPEESLFTISRKLRRHNIHSMPVLDVEQNAVVSVLTHRHLLSYLLPRFVDSRRLFDQPICLLGLGVFDAQVVVVPEGASIISLLNVMWERKISAVPVVNELGQVVDLYGRKDISFLANDPTFMVLDAPVGEVRKAQIKMVSRLPRWRGVLAENAHHPLHTHSHALTLPPSPHSPTSHRWAPTPQSSSAAVMTHCTGCWSC